MLLTLLTSKKAEYLLSFSCLPVTMLVNYHNFDKQSPGAMI